MELPSKKIIVIGTITGVVVAGTYIVYKHFQRKAVREILAKKVSFQTNLNLSDAFNQSRWKKGSPKMSDTLARATAKTINESIGWFTEDESKISSAFYNIKNYDDLSLIAYQYNQLFQEDLYAAIKEAYKNDEQDLAKLRSIIAKKISYK